MKNASLLLLVFLGTVALSAGVYQKFYGGRRYSKLPAKNEYCTPAIKTLYKPPVLNRKCYYAFSVCSNGHILLLPNKRSRVSKYASPKYLGSLRGHPIISAFWARGNVKCGKGSTVTYGQSCKRSLLRQIKSLVNDAHFSPQAIIWATYRNMHPLKGGRQTNQFQIILATHGTVTYAIFIYRNMGWNRSCRKCRRPYVGYADGKGNGYQYCLPANAAGHLRHSIKIFRVSDRVRTKINAEADYENVANLEEALNEEKSSEVKLQDDSDDYDFDGSDDDDVSKYMSEEQDAEMSEAFQDILAQEASEENEDDDGDDANTLSAMKLDNMSKKKIDTE